MDEKTAAAGSCLKKINSRAGLTFKFAESFDELEQVFQLLHDAYVKRGVMLPEAHGLRITKWHLLPTTDILIAKLNAEVVATISLIRDNPFGLPMESMWSLSHLRRQGALICELSGFALKDEVRMRPTEILMPLMSFVMHYTFHHSLIDIATIATHVKSSAFYRDYLGFQSISSDVVSYDFVKGAQSLAQFVRPSLYWELVDPSNYAKIRMDKKSSRYYDRLIYLVDNPYVKDFQFFRPSPMGLALPKMNNHLLRYFAFERTGLSLTLTQEEIELVNQLSQESLFHSVVSSAVDRPGHGQRLYVNKLAMAGSEDKESQPASPIKITALSRYHMSFLTPCTFSVGEHILLNLKANSERSMKLRAQVKKAPSPGQYEVDLLGPSPSSWHAIVTQLESTYNLRACLRVKKASSVQELSR